MTMRRVPHLLIQLQDDLTRSRRREAAWISIIVHLILIILLCKIDEFEKYLPWHSAVAVKTDERQGLDVPGASAGLAESAAPAEHEHRFR